jgi:hypothetical protein
MLNKYQCEKVVIQVGVKCSTGMTDHDFLG